MKIQNLLFCLLVIVCLTLSCFSKNSEQNQVSKCGLVLENVETQFEKVYTQYLKQDFSKVLIETTILAQYLPTIQVVCPVMYDQHQFTASKTDRVAPIYCSESISKLAQIISEKRDIVSEFQIIKEEIDFIVDECLAFDLQSEFGESYSFFFKEDEEKSNKLNCIGCTFGIQLMENYIDFHNLSYEDYFNQAQACNLIPLKKYKESCQKLFQVVSPVIIQGIKDGKTSDEICDQLGSCNGWQQCSINAPIEEKEDYSRQNYKLNGFQKLAQSLMPTSILDELIHKVFDEHLPAFDLDGDRFSQTAYLRGYDWRGQDCNQYNNKIYPGRKTATGKKGVDFNCNSIEGVNSDTGETFNEQYCKNSNPLGTIDLGDSAGAHFSLPGKYFNVSEWNQDTFKDIIHRGLNEFDLPQKSAGTGWQNETDVSSFYLKYLERNRCNRNDYQNLGVNGAKSTTMTQKISTLARSQTDDNPVMIFYELIGNDVCNGHEGFDHMTTPEEFKAATIKNFQQLDSLVPKGSYMVISGVGDGTILYDCLQDKVDPAGIPYPVFYKYLNCMQTSPCWGWMNTDADVRKETTRRAMELNQMYVEILQEETYENLEIQYYDFPMEEILVEGTADGYTCQQMIEPVDGFHPSQIAQKYWADILWKKLEVDRPHWQGVVNPFNSEIIQSFGSGTNYFGDKTQEEIQEFDAQKNKYSHEEDDIIELYE